MESLHSKITIEAPQIQPQNAFKTRRDELVDTYVQSINKLRLGTKWRPITHKEVALRLRMNPFLKKDDGEVELLLKECIQKGDFKKFFWTCPMNKKLSTPNPQVVPFRKKRDMNV